VVFGLMSGRNSSKNCCSLRTSLSRTLNGTQGRTLRSRFLEKALSKPETPRILTAGLAGADGMRYSCWRQAGVQLS
jgi:hypothetical protein